MDTIVPKLRDIFSKAAEIGSAAEQAAYLDEACRGDAELRAQVEALLQAQREAGSFLQEAAALRAGTIELPGEQAGAVIGQYKLLEKIGEGGMGAVWMAQQHEPVKRLVAVKLIKAGMDSQQVIARFEAERQALALMDHPNIARVLDGGTTKGEPGGVSPGRPYFVMDLVKGVPITRYCDEHHLTPRQRLELFVPVCQAIQHAHHKGIIHRDLKPSNVLVALYDGKPVPKVIDFGVAKAAGQSLTDKTLVTGFGAIVGTLEYMSPEQAEVNQLDIDTRSDIYSLGVLLYELLTGSPPFSRKDLEKAGMMEMLRVIREQEPSKPSTKLSTAEGLPTLAANRGTEPAKLTKMVRGELDWIVMKALEKDRSRRYETANGFALDVQRYLADEPVLACPPSLGYRLRKFVRRNKGFVLAASLIILALVGGVIGTTIGLLEAEEARRAEEARAENEAAATRYANTQREAAERAVEAERHATKKAQAAAEAERLATQHALKRLAQIEKGVELFAGLVRKLDPHAEELGGPPLYDQLRQRAVQAADELVEEAVGDAEAMARLQTVLGTALLDLGEPRKAMELLNRARATRQSRLGAEHPETLVTMNSLAGAYSLTGKLTEAIALFEEIRDINIKKWGATHPDTLVVLTNLASTYLSAGRTPEAVGLFKQIRTEQEKMLEADDSSLLHTLNGLAAALKADGKAREAIALLEHVRDTQAKKLGPEHASTLATLNILAGAYEAAGKLPQAIALLEKVGDARMKKLGANHPDTLSTLQNLACALQDADRLPEAIALLEKVRDARVKQLGADHPDTLTTLNNLGEAYREAGRLPETITLLEHVRAVAVKTFGPDHPNVIAAMNNLAVTYQAVGKLSEAIVLFEKVRDDFQKKLGADHPHTLKALHNLAAAYDDDGRLTEAIALYEHVRDKQVKDLDAEHPDLLNTLNSLANAYRMARRLPEAIALFEQLRDKQAKKLGAGHPDALNTLNNLGVAYLNARRLPEAIALLEQVRDVRIKKLGPDHLDTLTTLNNLGTAYRDTGRLPEAIALFRQVHGSLAKRLGPDHPKTLTTLDNLAAAFAAADEPFEAVPLFEKVLRGRMKVLGPEHPNTLATMSNLAGTYGNVNRPDLALPLYLKTIEKLKAKRGPEHPQALNEAGSLGHTYSLLGQYAEAEPLLVLWIDKFVRKQPVPASLVALRLNMLGACRVHLKKYANAEGPLRESLAFHVKHQPRDILRHETESLLGAALAGQKKHTEAEPLLLDGYKGLMPHEKMLSPLWKQRIADAALRLVQLYEAIHKEEDAAKWRVILEQHEGSKVGAVHDVGDGLKLHGKLDGKTAALVYEVKLTAGKIYVIDMVSPDVKVLDPFLVLQDADHQVLAQDDYSGGNLNARITYRVPSDGVYRIRATCYGGDGGEFTLTVHEAATVGAVQEVGDGLTRHGKLDAKTSSLVYEVRLSAGTTYAIDMVSPDQKALDPYLVLTDSGGTRLAEDDDSGGGLNARLIYRVPRDGVYRIHATSFNMGRGEFTLTVRAK